MNPYLSTWLHPRQTIRHIISIGGDCAGTSFCFFVFSSFFYLLPVVATVWTAPPGWIQNLAIAIVVIVLGVNYFIARLSLSWAAKMYARIAGGFGSEIGPLQARAAILWSVAVQVTGGVFYFGLFCLALVASKLSSDFSTLLIVGGGIVVFFWVSVTNFLTWCEALELSAGKTFLTLLIGVFVIAIAAALFLGLFILLVLLIINLLTPAPKNSRVKKKFFSAPPAIEQIWKSSKSKLPGFSGKSEVSISDAARNPSALPAEKAKAVVTPAAASSDYEGLMNSGKKAVFHLKDGKILTATIVAVEAAQVYLDTADGVMTLSKSDIQRVES